MPPSRSARPALRRLALLASLVLASGACGKSSSSPTPAPTTFTLHYHRPLADYAGWVVQTSAGAEEASATSSGSDGFGATYALTLKAGAPTLTFTLQNGGSADAAGTLSVDVSGGAREAWVFSGFSEAIPRKLPALPGGPNQAAVYYFRPDGVYAGWGLHLWGDQVTWTTWGSPLSWSGTDPEFGAGFLVDLTRVGPAGNCPVGSICLIVHKGDQKDPGPDMSFSAAVLGNIVFLKSGSQTITATPRTATSVTIDGMSAHLVARDTVAWTTKIDPVTTLPDCAEPAGTTFELRWSATADVQATAGDIAGGTAIPLTPRPAGLGSALEAKIPRLKGWCAFDVAPADLANVEAALKGQIVAVKRNPDGTPAAATQVQIPYALDDLYPYAGPLGLTFATVAGAPTFVLWAPTAQSVKLHVYDGAKAEVASSPFDMTAGTLGEWTYSGPAGWYGLYYSYELQVYHYTTGKIETVTATDPWAVNLDTNGQHAQVVDLADPALAPAGWGTLAKPALDSPTDIVAYEAHVRDFSASDATVPATHRGTFLAFTDQASDGMTHLATLAAAGLTHVHLLPAFDIATVDEDPANRVDLDDPFSRLCAANPAIPAMTCTQFAASTVRQALQSYPGDSDQQQAIVGYMKALDSFNWGYDPFHYGAPEGSYASTAEGTAKILEFRQMVQGLAEAGLRVVMDVVYNHTNAAGLSPKSVLDKVVPGYYHRLNPWTGYVESSSCCANTATEHRMMGRLMTDTLVRWARDYKVDGFRLDLMGLHLKADVLASRAALAALTPGADGVDGSKIYLYGEGWDMGETAKNACGINANQVNMAGTGIGTFNDRLRDGVRGGSPFDNGAALVTGYVNGAWTCTPYQVCGGQGFATGLYLAPNAQSPADATARAVLLAQTDWIKAGMAGNLRDFVLTNSQGTTIKAGGIGYSGAATGYTLQPQEAINYVSAHDNQTLWDIAQYKLPGATSAADRVRVQNLALDTILLGEGIPFLHMGDELLRSKSEDRNSYDSGDWFNRVDWTRSSNNWKVGLPPAGDNQANWGLITPLFGNASVAVGAAETTAAFAHLREMLQVRKSSPLLRLAAGTDVKTRVDFPNAGPSQVPGLIVMTITDGTCAGADLDPARDALLVIVNADVQARSYAIPGATGFTLHPILQGSADPVVRTATFEGATGTFTVPARTTAVFEQLQGGAQGVGLPCNTRVSI